MAKDNFKLIDFKMPVIPHKNANRKLVLTFKINKEFSNIEIKAIDTKFPTIDTTNVVKFEMPNDKIINRHIQKSKESIKYDKKIKDSHKV